VAALAIALHLDVLEVGGRASAREEYGSVALSLLGVDKKLSTMALS
jgi:hypothetical protein